MSKEQKEFLEEQLKWTKDRISILDEMDKKLHEMKKVAGYAAESDLSVGERGKLSTQLELLKNEYSLLETKYSLPLSKNLV